jgi:uncharacterized protein (DUF2236 family)
MMNQKREIKDQSTAAGDNLEDPSPFNETIRMESDICGGADPLLLDALENPQNIRCVVQEGIILAGGAVAILLQVAAPGVARGVDEHSNFAYRPVDRLRTTMTYIYCMAFGTREEKRIVVKMVHLAHASVNGPGYSADDPTLQLWVAATLYAVGTGLYQRIFGNMDEETAEALYREYAILAVSLRVRPEMWPANRKAFWKYWDHQIATLQITEYAERVAKDLLYNTKAPLRVRAVLPLVRLITTEMLPPRLQDAFGLKSNRSRRRLNQMIMVFTKAVYPHIPKSIRTYSMQYYLKDMRRRIQNVI